MATGLPEGLRRLFVTEACGRHEDSLGPLFQFLAVHAQVHHHVLVYLAQPDHRGGRDHVKDHFLGCS